MRRRDGREEEGLCRIQRALARWKAKKNSVAEASAEVLRLVYLRRGRFRDLEHEICTLANLVLTWGLEGTWLFTSSQTFMNKHFCLAHVRESNNSLERTKRLKKLGIEV